VSVLPLGTPEEQGERYARAWVTALPSRSDTFGLVLIESLAAGTPIVVLDDAAPPELVVGGNGAISPSLEPEDLAKALQQGLDLAATPGIAELCRSSVQQYDWDGAIAPLLENVYLQGRAPSPIGAPTHT
jgi:glycosyltransferase involved in cell wall biosynthesis